MSREDSKRIVNSFTEGLDLDTHVSITNNTSYKYALNVINNDADQNTFLSNEHSNRKVAQYGSKIVGRKYINEINSTVIFLQNGEIHLFNHDKEESKFVASDTEFGCNWGFSSCEWVEIFNYYQYICDLWLTYSSNRIYYNINLTELLDPARKAGLKTSLSGGCGTGCSIRSCEYFRVFKKSCDPHIEAIVLDGGNLRNGTYFIGGRYKNNQGGYSNPFPMSPALHVGGGQNIAGEVSNKRIEITLTNSSCVFDQIEFFVHEMINGNQITKALPVQYIGGKNFTVQYDGSENLVAIDMAELLVNSRTYVEGEDLYIHNNRALYYRTTPEYEYNFQPIANQIQVNWYAVKVPMEDVKKYNLKSLLRGETYAFAISPNYESGKKGYGFHIPAVSGGGCAPSSNNNTQESESSSESSAFSGSSGGGSSSGNNGSSSKQSLQSIVGEDGKIKLYIGGCNSNTAKDFYIDTDNFCTATKIYKDKEKTNLADADIYKVELNSDAFERPWIGTEFSRICNVCISTGGGGGGGASQTASISGSATSFTQSNVSVKLGLLYTRVRGCIPSTINNLSDDDYIDKTKSTVNSWLSDIDDINKSIEAGCGDIFGSVIGEDGNINCDCGDAVDAMCEEETKKQRAAIARKDSAKAEEIGATWFNAIANYMNEQSEPSCSPGFTTSATGTSGSIANLITNPAQTISKFKEASKELINAIQNRERTFIQYEPHEFSKADSDYSSDELPQYNQHKQEKSSNTSKGFEYDEDGNLIPIDFQEYEVELGTYKKYPIIAKGKTEPKFELSKYPCVVDCNGNPIYCGLQNQQITHHKMPGNDEVPFWVPKAVGDGSTFQTDTSIMDGYAILLGAEFTNINIPDTVQARLCPTNPYNIGMVRRDGKNSSVLLKGIATETYTGVNQGKQYLYFKYGVNSFEKISKYIDSDGKGTRMGGTADNTSSVLMYSLDQLVRKPFLNGTHLIREGTMRGTGARHFLYARGFELGDNRASRYDQGGSVHTVTLGQFSPKNDKIPLSGQIYVGANLATSPPTGASIPLMNKSGQSCAWLIADGAGRGINDNSFVGDVYQHVAPITDAEVDYFSVFRELDDQYGELSALNYVPVLQARGFKLGVWGLIGDTYIGPYSFVKTGYVSDKVGNYFTIGAKLPGKSDRCICDSPEDAVFSLSGQWYWKELPKDGDLADAKNWAGTHSPTGETRTWADAAAIKQTETHYYYPNVTKHLITYVGESESNPWLREKSKLLENQWYPEIHSEFTLHSKDVTTGDPATSYLNQYHKVIEQPSKVKIGLKALIKSFMNIAIPLLGINDITNPQSVLDFTGDLVSSVMNLAVWLLLSQVLFTSDFVDKLLGLEACARDEEGGENARIDKFFTNYVNYNHDYSVDYFFPTIKGLPMEYTGCICTDSTTNMIYVSDENDISYYVNGYQVVKPNSKINLEDSYGKLTKIYSIGDTLYMHTTDGIYASKIAQVQIDTNIGQMLMGSSNMMSTPQLITNSAPEGQAGLDHANHGKLTSIGFIFVDYNAKQLLIFSGSGFQNISLEDSKLYTFFKKYLKFCNSSNDCKFEQVENTNYYAFGLDSRFNRIMFTKSDGDNSYTLSYDYKKKNWVSFHSYIPQEYLHDRNDLYSLYGNAIWKHDVTDKFTTYYDSFYGCKIDFNTILQQNTFQYQSTDIFTEAKVGNRRDRDITFNKVAVTNSWQSTGYINLNVRKVTDSNSAIAPDINKDKTNTIDLKRIENSFRFNEIRDYTNSYESDIVSFDECNPHPKIENGSNYLEIASQTYNKKIVSDNYLYYRFIFDTFDGVKLYIRNVVTYITSRTF